MNRPRPITDLDVPFATNSTLPEFIDDARALAAEAATAPPVPMLVDGMVMALATMLIHGDWRTLKTWILLELLIAGATQTPAFGVLEVPAPFSSLLITNEDGKRRIGERIGAFCRARGVDLPSGLIGVSSNYGVNYDDPTWRDRITREVIDRGYGVVAFDPLRSITATVDKGPGEFQPFSQSMRALIADTGATAAWVHHDAKPAVGVADTRRRGHRASGGGILSATDCPIHVERIGEEPRVIVTPAAWKHSDDPPALELELKTENRDGKLWTAEFIGRPATATSGAQLVLAGKIRTALAESPGLSGSAIVRRVQANKQAVLMTLQNLQTAGELDSYSKGKATCWMLATQGLESRQ